MSLNAFSSARASVSIFGEAETIGQNRFYTKASEIAQRNHSDGFIRKDDPRLSIDPNAVESLKLRTPAGLLDAAKSVQRDISGNTTDVSNVTSARLAARIQEAATGDAKKAGSEQAYGQFGVIARHMEEAGLVMMKTGNGHLHARRLFEIAAAAHDNGAREASLAGFENGLVVEAARKQGRNSLTVLEDLKRHGAITSDDPRYNVRKADMPETSSEAQKIAAQSMRNANSIFDLRPEPTLAVDPVLVEKRILDRHNAGDKTDLSGSLAGAFFIQDKASASARPAIEKKPAEQKRISVFGRDR